MRKICLFRSTTKGNNRSGNWVAIAKEQIHSTHSSSNVHNYIFYLIHINLWRAGGWGHNLIIYVKCSESFDSYHGPTWLQNWKGVKSMTLIHYSWTQLLWCDAAMTHWIEASTVTADPNHKLHHLYFSYLKSHFYSHLWDKLKSYLETFTSKSQFKDQAHIRLHYHNKEDKQEKSN